MFYKIGYVYYNLNHIVKIHDSEDYGKSLLELSNEEYVRVDRSQVEDILKLVNNIGDKYDI